MSKTYGMGNIQTSQGTCEQVRSTIRSIEDNSQHNTEGTLKQSIVQEVHNSGLGSGEFKAPNAHKGNKN